MEKQKRVVIVGGGFGGLNAAKSLRGYGFEILLIDMKNHHLFQPLLYQVASAALSPGDIAIPIREIFAGDEEITVLMGTVTTIDLSKETVTLEDGETHTYDYLILSPGSKHHYFGHDEWETFAPGLKTVNDALNIRENTLLSFEKAERCENPQEIARYLRFVIVGGGPTGVEMAGAIAEIAYKTMFQNFRRINPELSEIYLVEGESHVLGAYPNDLSDVARGDLEKMGIKVLTHAKVTEVNDLGVKIDGHLLETANVIWAAGNKASPLLKTLNVPLDPSGRVMVNPDLTIPEHPNVFVIGDGANVKGEDGTPFPGIAPVAIQQGKFVAKLIRKGERKPFHYSDKGMMATIGKSKAVAVIGKRHFHGFFAWLLWGIIHIAYLITFRNKLLVMVQWFFLYLTGNRQVRVIKTNID